jgi:hypothetical protein
VWPEVTFRNDHVDPGTLLATTHELDDGSRVRLRLTRPSDVPRIDAFLKGVDSDGDVRAYTFYDPRERLTVAATQPGDGGEEIVGLADVELVTADVDVLVSDDHADRGLDDLLAEAGTELASQRAA